MAPMEATLGNWLLAATPILVVLLLMLGLRWGGSKAGPAGWLAALLVSTLFFGAGAELLAYAQLRALLLALYVLYIIWAALLLYHMVNEAGAIEAIGSQLTSLTRDQGKLVLLLGWTFGSFLQGASGFGVPAAVVAPLLVGLGIPAGRAVVIALVGHAWAVTYGSLASSFLALIAATGQSGADLTPWTAAMLAVAGYGCGAALLWVVGGLRGWLREFGLWALLGTLMGGVQFLFAWLGFYTIASFLAGLAGLGLIILILRRNAKNLPESCHSEERSDEESPTSTSLDSASPASSAGPASGTREQRLSRFWALIPYGLLVVVVMLGQTLLADLLDFAVIRVDFPEVSTSLNWVTSAGPGRSINLFGHGGALLIYTILITYIIYQRQGRYRPNAARRIVSKTLRGATKSSIGILTMVGMAVMMENAGMTRLLAEGISRGVGSAFPVAAPLIGALGAFMTGSNTNSNVVFAAMQQQTALILHYNPLIILAAQTTGGAIGSLFAPAKVIVGCSTVNLGGQEGEVLRDAILYGLAILGLICLFTWAVT